ncbi:MAG: GFA family protein [Alphaproteobacteria bacterium]|nr:GFA family protein [Alphaproteobacteria bacterium]
MSEVTARGSCLCGGVRYQVTGPVQDVTACHCTQCRKQSGHYWASSGAADGDFELLSEEGLKWYRASDSAIRGFCATCGSALFWKKNEQDRISFSAGSLDEHPGVTLAKHIFTDDKGDYYTLEPKE